MGSSGGVELEEGASNVQFLSPYCGQSQIVRAEESVYPALPLEDRRRAGQPGPREHRRFNARPGRQRRKEPLYIATRPVVLQRPGGLTSCDCKRMCRLVHAHPQQRGSSRGGSEHAADLASLPSMKREAVMDRPDGQHHRLVARHNGSENIAPTAALLLTDCKCGRDDTCTRVAAEEMAVVVFAAVAEG